MATSDRPTAKQLRYLRTLANQTGTTFTPPQTRGQASDAIHALRRRHTEPWRDRRRERHQISDDLARPTSASAVGADEISGYGSHAHWR